MRMRRDDPFSNLRPRRNRPRAPLTIAGYPLDRFDGPRRSGSRSRHGQGRERPKWRPFGRNSAGEIQPARGRSRPVESPRASNRFHRSNRRRRISSHRPTANDSIPRSAQRKRVDVVDFVKNRNQNREVDRHCPMSIVRGRRSLIGTQRLPVRLELCTNSFTHLRSVATNQGPRTINRYNIEVDSGG